MLKVWIDVLTPKQALFFAPLYKVLRSGGHSLLVTTRRYREAQQALRMMGLDHMVVGEYGGGTALGKLLSSGNRIVKLASLIDKWAPNVSISFSSPDAARVSFGLGVPHVVANDSPHSWIAARLTIPLSVFVCSPWIIGADVWKAFGARGIVRYRALDAAAWLKRHRVDSGISAQLGLERGRPTVLFRTEETLASYLMGRTSSRSPFYVRVIRALMKNERDIQVLVSTRYPFQAPLIKREFGDRVRVIDKVVDTTSLIGFCSVFVGSGGTMTVEAALLGTPAISCFPGDKPLYISYLEKKGLVETILSVPSVVERIERFLESPKEAKDRQRRGKALLDWMEDPVLKLEDTLSRASK